MWDLDLVSPGAGSPLPAGLHRRPARDLDLLRAGVRCADPGTSPHWPTSVIIGWLRCAHIAFEALKIGAGPPPIRIDEGWLLIHHGVSGELIPGVVLQPNAHYAAGAMILSADDPSTVLARTAEPLMAPRPRTSGTASSRTWCSPRRSRQIDGRMFVFYGMADTQDRRGRTATDRSSVMRRFGAGTARRDGGRSAGHGDARQPVSRSGAGRAHRQRTCRVKPRLGAPLTNLAHLDFLTDQVAVPASAAHSTYRLSSEPTVGVLWVYANALPGRNVRPGRRRRL